MLLSAMLPKSLRGEAVNTTVYLVNRSPSTTLDFMVLEEVWSGRAPDYKHLRVLGCTAYAYVKQGKLEARARKCTFLGYPKGVKGYKLWYKEGNGSKTMISRDVIFREDQMYMADYENNGDQIIGKDTAEGQVEIELSCG